jgi:ABC-type multidrug transport system ATPase subunit
VSGGDRDAHGPGAATADAPDRAREVESRSGAEAQARARLELRSVSKRWDRRRPLIENVNLVLGGGAIVSITGPNGAGKTTLVRVAAGLIDPNTGTVRLDGFDPRRDRAQFQRRLGFVSAGSGGLYARISVRQHLDFWARVAFVPAPRRDEACRRMIDTFGIADLASSRVDRLSMGQRQRVRLAMAFLHEPRLLLFDEPWNSLDTQGADLLADVLHAFRARGGTAVFCTPTGGELAARLDVNAVFRLQDGELSAV